MGIFVLKIESYYEVERNFHWDREAEFSVKIFDTLEAAQAKMEKISDKVISLCQNLYNNFGTRYTIRKTETSFILESNKPNTWDNVCLTIEEIDTDDDNDDDEFLPTMTAKPLYYVYECE